MPGSRASWTARQGIFVVGHYLAGPAPVGVVFASPFGWEEMGSYPARRLWAETLSGAGIPAIRFDWPGTGDSAGTPADPGRLDSWREAYADVVDLLRSETGVGRVATIGLGLGGLVAVEAIRRGAQSEDLVLWPVFRGGRAWVRTERALSRLQSGRLPADAEGLPAGWIESNGYLVSAEMLGALETVESWIEGPSALERVLLLEREDVPVDEHVINGFSRTDVEVQTSSGFGYGLMIEAPHRPRPPHAVVEIVTDWLLRAPAGRGPTHRRPPLTTELDLPEGTERVIEIPCQRGSAFGIATLPRKRDPAVPTLVMLPAWAERRSGPSRVWTEAARRAAERGGIALRIDLPGIGDAVGDWGWLAHMINFHDPAIVDQVREILDAATADGLGERFVLVGLSGAAYWAFRTLAVDPRVVGALAVNPTVRLFAPQQQARELVRKLDHLFQLGWWRRVFARDVRLSSMLVIVRNALAATVARRRGRLSQSTGGSAVHQAFEAIAARGAHLVLAVGAKEGLAEALASEGIGERFGDWPRIRMVELDAPDHNIRPLRAQRQVHGLMQDLLDAAADDARNRPPVARDMEVTG